MKYSSHLSHNKILFYYIILFIHIACSTNEINKKKAAILPKSCISYINIIYGIMTGTEKRNLLVYI